ncbi:hypothetical protein A9K55_004780 [Cordyceps militaris]|uniref:Uncharacterized protein n=1 Tax=Cordyceps militaris TaxID=73501 RepID=A0A2H4SKZ6_CORMI|nr:hypothetical protein A9K55_004780 [Cordyceps militaris]
MRYKTQSLLRQRFHITPTTTSRHDQWFKRVYQSWVETDKQLLLLTPKVSRPEWAPEMLQLSAQLANHIQLLAAAERRRLDAAFPPRQDKLFPDSVLDEPPLLCPLHDRQAPVLTPGVQRGDWWPDKDPADLARVAKALLEHEQTAALLHVAQMRGVDMKAAMDCRKHGQSRGDWSTPKGGGWGAAVDEALSVFFFAAIIGTFPEELLTETDTYRNWLPYGGLLSDAGPPMRFAEALKKRPGFRGLRAHDDVRPHMERCVRILAAADLLHSACRLPAVDWAARIGSALLYFVGFEAWNRAREGSTYLHCHLNTAKTDRWLAHGLEAGDDGKEAVVRGEKRARTAKTARPRDPLLLRAPRADAATNDAEDEEQCRLADLEQEEAAYGSKRSTKYQRRKVRDWVG